MAAASFPIAAPGQPPLSPPPVPDAVQPLRPKFSLESDRRASIQFAPHLNQNPTASSRLQRRLSSPPPPSTFEQRVSFDTFDNKDTKEFSLTLNNKHKDYQYTTRSRTFLVGTDQNDYSEFALEWLINELVDDGDEIVCLRVIDKDSKASNDLAEEGKYAAEGQRIMKQIIAKNTRGLAISLVLEFAIGKVHDTIQRMIRIYEPAILIVGTRGRSLGGIQGLLPGSVSKYCLQHSPVPVIVVRPTKKRENKKKKRKADPARSGYLDLITKSALDSSQSVDISRQESVMSEGSLASNLEASAVASALGLPAAYDPTIKAYQPTSRSREYKVTFAETDPEPPEGSNSPELPEGANSPELSPIEAVMKDKPRERGGMSANDPNSAGESGSSDSDREEEEEEDEEDEDDDDDDDEEDGEGDGEGNAEFEVHSGHHLLASESQESETSEEQADQLVENKGG
ncbi:MAG: hypothetical protein M1829_003069 [Trizodia sp. TS-e1964]|nr:MAG: hypothetical protein M1829_003069 [Trizodia sp. TS-e1964]